jgi:hypothetical protein
MATLVVTPFSLVNGYNLSVEHIARVYMLIRDNRMLYIINVKNPAIPYVILLQLITRDLDIGGEKIN